MKLNLLTAIALFFCICIASSHVYAADEVCVINNSKYDVTFVADHGENAIDQPDLSVPANGGDRNKCWSLSLDIDGLFGTYYIQVKASLTDGSTEMLDGGFLNPAVSSGYFYAHNESDHWEPNDIRCADHFCIWHTGKTGGVWRLYAEDKETTDPCLGVGSCSVVSAATWGDSADCPSNNFMFAACGSGQNLDCDGHPVKAACQQYTNITEGTSQDRTEVRGSYGEQIMCPEGQAVVSLCGSGMNADCGGSYTSIQCGTPVGHVSFLEGDRWVDQPYWGTHHAICKDGWVMTGYCGSGQNKDCNGNVVQIHCEQFRYEKDPGIL